MWIKNNKGIWVSDKPEVVLKRTVRDSEKNFKDDHKVLWTILKVLLEERCA